MLPNVRYRPDNRDELIRRLAEITTELVAAYEEVTTSAVAQEQAYLDGMQHSTAESVAGQQRDGRFQRFATWEASQDIDRQVRQLEAERDLIRLILTLGTNGAGD